MIFYQENFVVQDGAIYSKRDGLYSILAHSDKPTKSLTQTILKYDGTIFKPISSIGYEVSFGQVSLSSTNIANIPYVLLWKGDQNSKPQDI